MAQVLPTGLRPLTPVPARSSSRDERVRHVRRASLVAANHHPAKAQFIITSGYYSQGYSGGYSPYAYGGTRVVIGGGASIGAYPAYSGYPCSGYRPSYGGGHPYHGGMYSPSYGGGHPAYYGGGYAGYPGGYRGGYPGGWRR